MNPDKDYYAILGILPGAEDIVVRAAYRALAQRYHPDRFRGAKGSAHARMSELNEAYDVLSDPEKRESYDRRRGAKFRSGGSRFSDAEEKAPPGDDPLENDWRVALKYYPDLAARESRLAQFSWKLANTYRAYLLETRQFESRELLAGLMENHFLQSCFGDREKCVDFARKLILAGQRKAALAFNDALRVLGSGADPGRIIAQIAREFDLRHLTVNRERIGSLLQKAKSVTEQTDVFFQVLAELGGTFAPGSGADNPVGADAKRACAVEFEGQKFEFPSAYEFRVWFRREIMPVAEAMMR